jgi:hypothetical protein
LAHGGLHPVVALYATFLNRAFDQLVMDVALHGVAVTFVLDRAGITGPDGPSHQLGIRMTYHPGEHEIRVEATLHPDLLAVPNGPELAAQIVLTCMFLLP